jgi:hypothetical protein
MEMKKKMKKPKEIIVPTSQEEDAFIAAEETWQEEFEAENRFKEELLYEGALIERKRIMDALRRFLEQEENAPVKPVSVNDYKDPTFIKELLVVEGIDVIKLINDLEERKSFESKQKSNVVSWFNGFLLRNTIPIKVSADIFVSLIADIMDLRPSHIKNTKDFVSFYIALSFTFKGKKCKESTIRQIMKPGIHKNRISFHSEMIPNINDFKMKSTT